MLRQDVKKARHRHLDVIISRSRHKIFRHAISRYRDNDLMISDDDFLIDRRDPDILSTLRSRYSRDIEMPIRYLETIKLNKNNVECPKSVSVLK